MRSTTSESLFHTRGKNVQSLTSCYKIMAVCYGAKAPAGLIYIRCHSVSSFFFLILPYTTCINDENLDITLTTPYTRSQWVLVMICTCIWGCHLCPGQDLMGSLHLNTSVAHGSELRGPVWVG